MSQAHRFYFLTSSRVVQSALAVLLLLLLGGCNTVTPHLNVYDGLLPAGYQMKEALEPMRADALKGKTLVLVTSTNFNNYTTVWQEYHEKGGEQRFKQTLIGAVAALATPSDGGANRIRQASDPRNVVDRVHSALRPYFKSVQAASDFAQAQDLKADYIALIDFHGTFNEMGDEFRTKGGVYLLDGTLRRVFQAEGNAEVDREDGGFMGGTAGVIEGTARTYAKGLDLTTNQILSGVRAKLGTPSR